MVGTKLDLLEGEGNRQVRTSQGRELAIQQHQLQLERALKTDPNTFLKNIDGSTLYYETSSKTGEGVDRLFEDIQSTLLADLEKARGGGGGGGGGGGRGSIKSKAGVKSGDGVLRLGDDTDGGADNARRKSCCGGD